MVTQPAIAIILGSPASGKTSLGLRLAADLALPCFCKDDIKEALFDSLGGGDRDWSSRLSRASFACVLRLVETQIRLGGRCLIEGNWRALHLPQLCKLAVGDARPPELRWAQVLCRASSEEALRRFHARRRHPGHLDDWPDAERAVLMSSDFLALPGPCLRYDSEHPEGYQELRRQLEAWFAATD
jgi:predicted kinase